MITRDKSVLALKWLLEAMLDEPSALAVEIDDTSPGVLFLRITDAAEGDRAKLIGLGGAHIRALRFIAHRLGQNCGERWDLVSRIPNLVSRNNQRGRKPDRPVDHNPSNDSAALHAVLTALLVEAPRLLTAPDNGDYIMKIEAKSHADLDALHTVETFDNRPLNLLTELGTLLRSIGGRQGVLYRVEASK